MRYRVATHEVTALPIAEVLPLVIHERIQPPQTGVVLVLEEKRLNWIPEGGKVPTAGDTMMTDPILGVAYVIPAEKFVEPLFSAAEEETDHVRRA